MLPLTLSILLAACGLYYYVVWCQYPHHTLIPQCHAWHGQSVDPWTRLVNMHAYCVLDRKLNSPYIAGQKGGRTDFIIPDHCDRCPAPRLRGAPSRAEQQRDSPRGQTAPRGHLGARCYVVARDVTVTVLL